MKYTKTELRSQQIKLTQLQKYLPTLQLKKAMLQLEIHQVSSEVDALVIARAQSEEKMDRYKQLLSTRDADPLFSATTLIEVERRYENIAGVEIPIFEKVVFEEGDYSLFDTSYWLETAISDMRHFIEIREKLEVLQEKKRLLLQELREVSIRVNLFEKIMIPRAKENIKKIKIFLGDQQLAAVSQAKASKRKILQRKGAL